MTELAKNFEGLSFSDLVDACALKGIEVKEDDNRDILLKKLGSAKPKPKGE